MNQPKYKTIADFLTQQINTQQWVEGFKIPSETELATTFSASRMTARKAIDKVVDQRLLERVPSVGTFVKAVTAQSSLLEIKNIAAEITERGHQHRMTVLSKMTLEPNESMVLSLSSLNTSVFKIIIIHHENGVPIQLEERYVNADKVPEFLQQDFSKITAHEYLSSIAPLTEAEIAIEAVMPSKILRHNLAIDDNTPCLKVSRNTHCNGAMISYAVLYYPANRYKLTSVISNLK